MILVCWHKFVSRCLHGWVLAHFRHLVLRNKYLDYDRADPYVGRWKSPRGYSNAGHFRGLMDSMEHCHVIWRLYEHQRDVTPFQDVCWYSRWIMVGKQKMVCHLSERVLRHYNYVHTIPIPPTSMWPLGVYSPRRSRSPRDQQYGLFFYDFCTFVVILWHFGCNIFSFVCLRIFKTF